MSEQNIQLVQAAYAAFKRGDIPGVLSNLAEDIDWHFYGPKELPTSGQRKGKAEVQRFFKNVDDAWQFTSFEPRQFITQGDEVVVLGSYAGTAKGTGRKFDCQWSHVFTIQNGKCVRWREYTDTATLLEAYTGAPVKV